MFADDGSSMPPEPGRFHTAARYYLQGRPPYATPLIRRVVQMCGVGTTCRVLGLGVVLLHVLGALGTEPRRQNEDGDRGDQVMVPRKLLSFEGEMGCNQQLREHT
jgi:hypothetical protein